MPRAPDVQPPGAHPALDRAIDAQISGSCDSLLLEAALAEGADPASNGWEMLAFYAAAYSNLAVVKAAWARLDEGKRSRLLDSVLSLPLGADQRVKIPDSVRLLARLAGQSGLEAHASRVVAKARCNGQMAFAQALATLDALTEHVEDRTAWADFCLNKHSWDPRLLPSTAIIHRALSQRTSLGSPHIRSTSRHRA